VGGLDYLVPIRMHKRLQMLEKLVAEGSADPFHHYALALEYKSAGQTELALERFRLLREAHPTYLPTYLLAGSLLAELDRGAEARPWFEQGIEVARSQSNGKALGELEEALADLGSD
jgi:tetratricopeptide (TPR) repeat protein